MPDTDTTAAADAPADAGAEDQAATETATTTASKPGPDLTAELTRHKAMNRRLEGGWAKTTKELEQARQDLADRDLALSEAGASAAGEVAAARLEAALARAGMGDEQIENYVKFIDPNRLLKEGKPDPDAIKAIAASVPAALRTGPPDPDQGRRNSAKPKSMNDVIRQAAGLQS